MLNDGSVGANGVNIFPGREEKTHAHGESWDPGARLPAHSVHVFNALSAAALVWKLISHIR